MRYTVYTPVQHLSAVAERALALAGGYTASAPNDGAWRDDAGNVHHDKVVKLDVITDKPEHITELVTVLKGAGELAVLVERHMSEATFY